MIQITPLFLYKIVFFIEIMVVLHIISFRLNKKNNFIWRFIITSTICFAFSLFFPLFDEISYTWWYVSLMFLIIFLVCLLSLRFIYVTNWQKLFYIGVIAYTSQHLSFELFRLFSSLFGLVINSTLGIYGQGAITIDVFTLETLFQILLFLLTHSIVYTIIFICFGISIRKKEIQIKSLMILIISALVLLIDIILNSVILYRNVIYDNFNAIIISIYNILCCLLIIYFQYSITQTTLLETELSTTKRLFHQATDQYEKSKENIDLINLKCHDLKYQIRNYMKSSKLSEGSIEEVENIINIYDTRTKTGNKVLDLILTEQGLKCQKQNIILKCYADCSQLNFIDDTDLYVLFGNAIDNSLEAVAKIDDKEKRNINLVIKNVNQFVAISLENYFVGEIELTKDGLPLTTKQDKDYHGYGTKSIKLIVDKYNGNMNISTENNVFSLNVIFPIPRKSNGK